MGRDGKNSFLATCIQTNGTGTGTGVERDDLYPRQEQSAGVVTSVGGHAQGRARSGESRAACVRAKESAVGNEGGSKADGRRERCCTRVCRSARGGGIMTQAGGHLLCNAMCKRE